MGFTVTLPQSGAIQTKISTITTKDVETIFLTSPTPNRYLVHELVFNNNTDAEIKVSFRLWQQIGTQVHSVFEQRPIAARDEYKWPAVFQMLDEDEIRVECDTDNACAVFATWQNMRQ